MDLKHFSHLHPLTYHQMEEQPPAETLICYGCDLQIHHSPNTFYYTCWQCHFFLHDQCFRAPRSLSHPSHSAHPLSLIPYPTYPCGSFICNTCNQQGTGFSYSCSTCDYDLHVNCAIQTTPIPYPNHVANSDYLFPPSHTAHWDTGSAQYPGVQYQENMMNNTPNQGYLEASLPHHNNFFPNIPNHEIPYPQSHPQNSYPPSQSQYPNSHYPSMNGNVPINKPPPVVGGGVEPIRAQPQGAPQGVKHYSHEHVLNLIDVKEKNVKCSGCEKEVLGLVYRCDNSGCMFNLHRECFGLPREFQHEFHKEHMLILLTNPPDKEGYTCNGCLKSGKSFSYHCSICKYDIHVSCAFLQETVKRDDHTHSLSLIPALPDYKEEDEEHVPSCDVCHGVVDVKNSWFYLCQECDFGTHAGCVDVKVVQPIEKTKEELLAAALIELQVLELKQRLSKLNADFTIEGANNASHPGIK